MNKERRKRIKEAMEALDTVHDILIDVCDEEQEAFDNLPEGIQNGERGEQMNEYITSRRSQSRSTRSTTSSAPWTTSRRAEIRADESIAMFMDEQDAIRDREIFVHNLGELLSQTRDGVVSCELIDAEKPTEHVVVTYRNGYTKKIGTHMDSYAAIIRDVASRFQ